MPEIEIKWDQLLDNKKGRINGHFPQSLTLCSLVCNMGSNLGETGFTVHHCLKTVRFMSQGVSSSFIREGECWDDVFGGPAPLPS